MLTPTELHSVADKLVKPVSRPLFVWITGPAAAGKSFVLGHLAKDLANRGKIATFSDFAVLLAEIERDTEHIYHIEYGQSFLVTNPALDDLILHRLVVQAEEFQGDYFLIELGRGQDSEGRRDLSYRRLLSVIPQHILEHSIFLYLHCPYSERSRRDECRKFESGNHYDSPAVMERFFRSDDFLESGIATLCQVVFLDNS